MNATGWDPEAYARFAGHRLRPVRDLLARVPLAAPRLIYDLGCGDGRASRALAERWPRARLIGVDSSPAMLAAAARQGLRARWVEADIAAWRPERPADLVFANASLHWLDGHERLLPRLAAAVAPGGALAIQMPRNHEAPSHRAIAATVAAGPWRERLRPLLRERPVGEPAWYYDLLAPHVAALEVWESVYLHALEGEDAVLRWLEGTALRPLLSALDEDEATAFRAACAARLDDAYPRRADGSTLLPFRRLFLVGIR